jgi:S-adenosylmethionine synthetase
MVMIFGEITTAANVNYEQVIREALKDIGYDDVAKGLDYRTCNVIVAIEEQVIEVIFGYRKIFEFKPHLFSFLVT